jgi:hypothetical protein
MDDIQGAGAERHLDLSAGTCAAIAKRACISCATIKHLIQVRA